MRENKRRNNVDSRLISVSVCLSKDTAQDNLAVRAKLIAGTYIDISPFRHFYQFLQTPSSREFGYCREEQLI